MKDTLIDTACCIVVALGATVLVWCGLMQVGFV